MKAKISSYEKFTNLLLCLSLCISCACQRKIKLPNSFCSEYSIQELEYFSEIAFGSEFGKGRNDKSVRWFKDVKIKVFGEPNEPSDTIILRQVVETLDSIIKPINVSLTEADDYNVRFDFIGYFEAKDKFKDNREKRDFPAPARFTVKRIRGEITSAQIILVKEARKKMRPRLIWEETVQIMGLMQDRPHYPTSIFYDCSEKQCDTVTEASDLDLKLVTMLYNWDLPKSLSKKEFINAIEACR